MVERVLCETCWPADPSSPMKVLIAIFADLEDYQLVGSIGMIELRSSYDYYYFDILEIWTRFL